MEPNPPILAKKAWNLMRLMFFMLKKNISKPRFFADLNIMFKRGKLAGKSLHNLLFHHHHHWSTATFHRHPHHLPFPTTPPSDDEFSCTTTPQHDPFYPMHNKHNKKYGDDIDEIVIDQGVLKAVEMLRNVAESPGFGKSPVVKQLRVTDSPFAVYNGDGGGQVDEDAERFIMKFYNGLKRED